MNNLLPSIALLPAVCAPTVFAAELAGVEPPAPLTSGYVLVLFVATFLLLTLFADYKQQPQTVSLTSANADAASSPLKFSHSLAA